MYAGRGLPRRLSARTRVLLTLYYVLPLPRVVRGLSTARTVGRALGQNDASDFDFGKAVDESLESNDSGDVDSFDVDGAFECVDCDERGAGSEFQVRPLLPP